MYEFEEERWDESETESDEMQGVLEGWLIQRAGGEPAARMTSQPLLFLQIGTGQWCGAPYATLFPLESTAIVYAKEFGYLIGENVQIVRHRF